MARRSGFTLIELSIVLVIIGLLVGGIVAAQGMIRSAELRSAGKEFSNFYSATHVFYEKYGGWPGDLVNATSYWDSTTSGQNTTNGNGDNVIAFGSQETFLFWQHLAFAGLIEGHYTGTGGSGGTSDVDLGINIPASRLKNMGWAVATLTNYDASSDSNLFTWNYGNYFSLGTPNPNYASSGIFMGGLSPQEAWELDSKFDDGMPGRGKWMVLRRSDCTNAANATDYSSSYLLSSTNSYLCAFVMPQVF
jgi:prepilin-type N-terminal cleavage/methylation domain-containing protein